MHRVGHPDLVVFYVDPVTKNGIERGTAVVDTRKTVIEYPLV